MGKSYGESFYSDRHNNTIYSAKRIVSIVKDLIDPRSVVDLGCGVGTWLRVFDEEGVNEILGVEGEWLNEESLVIQSENFIKANLEQEFSTNKRYDLAVSLEVAEHIREEFADQFVDNLTNLAPVVLFSAAIPQQAGKHHVNEQWPDYWRAKFNSHGFEIIDCIRPFIWEDDRIEMWYAQNTFLYIKKENIKDYPKVRAFYTEDPQRLSAVLPRFYEHKLRTWPIMKAIRNRIKRALNN